MSAKAKRIERSQRFKRAWRGENRKKAVSPVVATLILILIAVAAAAALYLWLVAWQGGVTGGIGSPSAQYTVSIGGSTSVYPFDQFAVTQFEQNNTDVSVSNNQGGTGAGMSAVCSGQVNIGTASSLETPAGLVADGCQSAGPNVPVVTTFAYDAVDVIVPVANVHGLVSISWDTLTAIYDGTSTAPTLVAPSINGVSVAASPYGVAPWSTHAALTWSEIPAAVAGATVAGCTGTETVSTVVATPGGNSGVACSAPNADDYYTAATTSSSCGWTICAGGATGTASIVTVARSDASGTTQSFEARLLGATSATAFASSFTGLGFSGCGSNNLIADCGMTGTKTANGNPAVITTVAGNPDAIGYASDGLARGSTSGVTCQGVATAACGIAFEAPAQGAAVQPALGATGSIAGGIINGGFGPSGATTTLTIAQSYSGSRPFEYVTLGTPTGEIQRFISYVLDPSNNQVFATESAEVSVYSV
jgi:flagellin-like protein